MYCEIYTSPFYVILVEARQNESQATNVVQPDISIICDKKKLTQKCCIGIPEIVIEVVYESNFYYNYIRKLNLHTI